MPRLTHSTVLLNALTFVLCIPAIADDEFNYDESKVPEFELPDPLVTLSGEAVTDEATWRDVRRAEVLGLFEQHVYGVSPGRADSVPFELTSITDEALDGKAVRKEVTIWFLGEKRGPSMSLLLYAPNRSEPSPAFLGLNFGGNHAASDEPDVTLNTGWFRNRSDDGYVEHRATEQSRGSNASRWALEMIVERGYAVGTIYYGDIDPDFDDGFQNGVHPLFDGEAGAERAADAWGSIAAWAWGLSRGLDYLELDDDVDASRVAVLGHSRLGKTALWAGAQDERFALVISNNSGCGGAALSRRRFGETVARINRSFPHWFCDRFNEYNGNEDALPVDQHMLVSLMAPRPVYIASAVEDEWADPRGEFLSGLYATPVYHLFGKQGLEESGDPAVDEPRSSGSIGYHVRSGRHDVTDYDWQQYLDFADKHLRKR